MSVLDYFQFNIESKDKKLHDFKNYLLNSILI